jgi:hypothetical protein
MRSKKNTTKYFLSPSENLKNLAKKSKSQVGAASR